MGQDTGRATLSREDWAKATLNISSFMLICTLALTLPLARTSSASTCWGAVGGAGPAQQWQDQPSDHVIKRKRCLCCSSVFDFALASKSLQCQRQRHLLRVIYSHWRAPFFAQQGEGQEAEEQSRQDARPCAAITRRRKHLNVFMWRLLSPRHLASQATTKMFPLLS